MPKPVIKKPFTTKIALLYILEKYGLPMREQLLSEAAIGVCDINYFTFRQCLHELVLISYVEAKHIDGCECFAITENGLQAHSFFVSRLPLAARQAICEFINQAKLKEKRQAEFECTVFPANDIEYFVRVTYKEGRNTLLDISFRAGDKQQAEKIRHAAINNKDSVYGGIYQLFATLAEKGIHNQKKE